MAVSEIEILVPPGPRGEVGFKIGVSGFQVFPYAGDDFMVTDDEKIRWSITDGPTSGDWDVIAYNTGAFNHTLEVRFLCDLVAPGASAVPAPIANGDLSQALVLSNA